MKWDNDPLKYEKYLIFDGIVKFSQTFQVAGDISIRSLTDFVDKFFEIEERNKTCK